MDGEHDDEVIPKDAVKFLRKRFKELSDHYFICINMKG